jgi:hypothetical protein
MKSACRELFHRASQQVTAKDISDFCPDDPGYAAYVRGFNRILSSGKLPIMSDFDVSETIGLTTWVKAEDEIDPGRFRRFRIFTTAVGMAILGGPEGPSESNPPNYLAIRLIEDAHALHDERLLSLLYRVFAEAHHRIIQSGSMSEEAPFFSLGQLIVTFLGHGIPEDIAKLADQVIAEADEHARHASNEFLWGCTFFNQLHDHWRHFVRLSFPTDASNDSVAALRDALLSS